MNAKLFALVLFLAPFLQGAGYDLIIRNARIVDGSGNPWFRADVGIRDGRIVTIGRIAAGTTAARTIDARNRVLAPGFIDVHTHIEGGIEKTPRGDNYLMNGVTSVVTGNCGGSYADLPKSLARLEEIGIGLNVSSLVGHNTVRQQVMGTANRHATPDEIAAMQELVAKAMRDGAAGLSTGLIYIPGTYASSDEVVALAKAAARYGGVYASHMRDEGAHVVEAIEEAVRVGREAGMPVQLSHFKIDNRRLWGMSEKTLALVDKHRREGVDVVVDQYPYDRSSTNLGITLPSWAHAEGKLKERLADPATRAKIAKEMETRLKSLGHKNYEYAVVAGCRWDRSLEGKSIREISRQKRGKKLKHEIETILEMQAQGGAQMIYHSMGTEDVERILRYPYAAVGSDSGVAEFGVGMPHPRSYGSNARVLAEFVRKRNVITLEDAIRKMTSLPARTFGFRDRGLVREGNWADLVLFDLERVQDKATFDKPHQFSEGFDFVLVNGRVMVDEGKLTQERAGKILRHPTT